MAYLLFQALALDFKLPTYQAGVEVTNLPNSLPKRRRPVISQLARLTYSVSWLVEVFYPELLWRNYILRCRSCHGSCPLPVGTSLLSDLPARVLTAMTRSSPVQPPVVAAWK